MPTLTMTIREWAQRWGMEAVLAVLAALVFLGCLGSVDIWGKREQRASAEALDTVDHGHWRVAQIQGRPRLEKPPLPRWTIATLISLTGRRDEWIVRLPSALAALGTVGLIYGLGCRLGGRAVGLSAGLVLTSIGFFNSELRQAGNDGPLAFFTTLALYAAWRRLNAGSETPLDPVVGGAAPVPGDAATETEVEGEPTAEAPSAPPAGRRAWNLVLYAALGLGFLTKGPIILILAALALAPYLWAAGRLREGLRLLADGRGALLFLVLALSWPVPVLVSDPLAARVWYLEMGQKAGTAGVTHHRHHDVLAVEWPMMTAPWVLLATTGVLLPFLPRGRRYRPLIWFPWSWAVGNLAMFCFWSVAKPNYFLPCLPGVALLVAVEWVRVARTARSLGARTVGARRFLQFHWVGMFVAAAVAPVVANQAAPQFLAPITIFAVALMAAVASSAWLWRRGSDAAALAPLVGAWAVGILLAYGVIAPRYNAGRSHRELAASLERMLPPDARTLMFFEELDEGLWFYLSDRALVPVPGSQPRYNKGFDLDNDFRNGQLELDPAKRHEAEKRLLVEWMSSPRRTSPYVLIRKKLYDSFAPALAGLAEPILTEEGLTRNELVLLQATAAVATQSDEARRR